MNVSAEPTATPRVALMDLNSEALAFAARRTKRRNVLEPVAIEAALFSGRVRITR